MTSLIKLIVILSILLMVGCVSSTGMVRNEIPDDTTPYIFDYLGTKPIALKDIDTMMKQLNFKIDTVDTAKFILKTEPRVLEYDERTKAKFIIESGLYSTKIPQDKGILTFSISESESDSEMVKVEMIAEMQPEGADSLNLQLLSKGHPLPLKIARVLRRTGRFEPRSPLIAP